MAPMKQGTRKLSKKMCILTIYKVKIKNILLVYSEKKKGVFVLI